MGDEGAGLRRQSKRTVELIAGDGECGYTSKGQGQGDDAERGPGKVGDAGCGDQGGDEGRFRGWSVP